VGFKVEESICKFAKKGLAPSQIGVILRDSHGIAQVRSINGSKILRILKAHGMFLFFIFFYFLWACALFGFRENVDRGIGIEMLGLQMFLILFGCVIMRK
jgi:hypothetical protein